MLLGKKPSSRRVIEGLEEQGLPVPPSLLEASKPQEPLDELGTFVWDAFLELDRTRSFTEDIPRAISFQELWCYLDLALIPLSEDDHEAFVMHFTTLDRKFISKEIERIKIQRKKEERKRSRK